MFPITGHAQGPGGRHLGADDRLYTYIPIKHSNTRNPEIKMSMILNSVNEITNVLIHVFAIYLSKMKYVLSVIRMSLHNLLYYL